MPPIFYRNDLPEHLFGIRELDFSEDLLAEPMAGLWIRLAAHRRNSRWRPEEQSNVRDDIFRQSLLISPGQFSEIFDKLESVGNVLDGLGRPAGWVNEGGGNREYDYSPFHRFQFHFTSVSGEPLVFQHADTSTAKFFINPDLWMFLGLEERPPGLGRWWDPLRGVEALVSRVMDGEDLEAVDIRTEYLRKYIQARQMSLIIGHYRQLLLIDPPASAIAAFITTDVTLGSRETSAKALLQNWGLRKHSNEAPFLQRRLHLWFEIKPPEIDLDDPWSDTPSFDPCAFTLPTTSGNVAPARWKRNRRDQMCTFQGAECDFMEHVYFRQEVLSKYEGVSGFDVKDDGSVRCRGFWGLDRSTGRIGNELIYTAIGDFAEGMPFEEWPHWQQFSAEPPSPEMCSVIRQETPIPKAVNSVVSSLQRLNAAFSELAASAGAPSEELVWSGSTESLAGRQLKWVYPANADDDEFLKRATLASTLVLEGLSSKPLREFLRTIGEGLHQNFEAPPKSLGSRTLLQRVSLVTCLINNFRPNWAEVPSLVRIAEGKEKGAEPGLKDELEAEHKRVRDDFAALAFLYDLRTFGGLAHLPSKRGISNAAANLGLPAGSWHRNDYLELLDRITESVSKISLRMESAAELISETLGPAR